MLKKISKLPRILKITMHRNVENKIYTEQRCELKNVIISANVVNVYFCSYIKYCR